MLNVLIVINHAPDYREKFFAELSKFCKLTVLAQPCASGGLQPPAIRGGYEYVELSSSKFGPFIWQLGLSSFLKHREFDVYCVDFNPRLLSSFAFFLRNQRLWKRWIWRGSVFGNSESIIIDRFRNYVFKRAHSTLVYNEEIARRIIKKYKVKSRSFNNTEIDTCDIVPPKRYAVDNLDYLNILFVGRYQSRKKIERLLDIAQQNSRVQIRLVGPGMENIKTSNYDPELRSRLSIFGRTVGYELKEHFDWAHVVFNPGHAGLLVMNAAKHGVPIVIDNASKHAPEYYMAVESGQPFVSFEDISCVNRLIDTFLTQPRLLNTLASEHQKVALDRYTFRYMVDAHLRSFSDISSDRT